MAATETSEIKINQDALASMAFEIEWRSETAIHIEGFYAERVNFYRDILPDTLYEALTGRHTGETVNIDFKADEALSPLNDKQIFSVRSSQIDHRALPPGNFPLKTGRFYPKGMLKDVTGVFRGNMEPFRCVGQNNGTTMVDFNHPLAGKEVRLSVNIKDVRKKTGETGGSRTDWMDTALNGPGMQGRWNGQPTDFFSGSPFQRVDENNDTLFYQKPRLVTHIDDKAIDVITKLYGKFLTPGMKVLDLMSSWKSHLPETLAPLTVTGLGMNAAELEENTQLSSFVVQDLNQEPELPFDNASFDAVICTVSIEYLINPFEIIKEISRVLKPDGYFVITFSDRWFPPKVIRIWKEIHPFERVGLVSELFFQSQKFKNLHTYSLRGLPRPVNDRYYPKMRHSDPVYAIWGQKI